MSRRALPAATVALALLTAFVLAFVTTSSSESCTSTGAETMCESTTETLLEHEGTSVLIVLLVPAALAVIGLVRPTPKVLTGVAIALGIGVLLGAMSVGLFFIPTMLAASFAAARAAPR